MGLGFAMGRLGRASPCTLPQHPGFPIFGGDCGDEGVTEVLGISLDFIPSMGRNPGSTFQRSR